MGLVKAGSFEDGLRLALARRHPRVEMPRHVALAEVRDGFSLATQELPQIGSVGFSYFAGREPDVRRNESGRDIVTLRAPSVLWQICDYKYLELPGWELHRQAASGKPRGQAVTSFSDGFAVYDLVFQAYICQGGS